MDSLHKIAEALLDRESLSGDEIDMLMRGEILPPQAEDGSVRRAAKAYEDMSRKFGDTPAGFGSAPAAGAPGAAQASGSAAGPASGQAADEGEFKLEEAPPPPAPPKKPSQDEE
jgi:cell division protease FtsH